jgi:2-hydroxychromene-2-carboxylate isomerase
MMTAPIDFWFTMGSTYTYLSVMRLNELERSSGHPFPMAAVPLAGDSSGNEARPFRG